MKVLFFGDIVGKQGREIVLSSISRLKKQYDIDLTIANAENSAHGKGITYKIYNQLINSGIDVITLGNHAFSKKDVFDNIDLMDRLVCPINHEKNDPKCLEAIVLKIKNTKVCITNILGQAMMLETSFSPYKAMDEIIKKYKNKCDLFITDFHGEATAEKRIFAEVYKDVCVAVLGTHTHVQTADERLINGCAFISDVGMCGAYDSIIGRDINECINNKVNQETTRYTVADGPAILSAVVIDIDEKNKKARSIERIQIRPY